MSNDTDTRMIALYLSVMEEIKDRISVTNNIYRNENGFPKTVVREICYLQFRCMCELIALGCLIAHGDIGYSRKIKDAWQADKLMNALSDLRPHFYPQPCEGRPDGIAGLPHINHLTKDDLIELWRESGNVLHRAPLTKYILPAGTKMAPIDFTDVLSWGEKIAGLLDVHWISVEESRGILVSLTEGEGGKARASIFDYSLADGRLIAVTHYRR